MDSRKVIKFNLYMSCVLLAIFVLMLVGITVAYFTQSKQITNTLTVGNVHISLTQSAVKADASGNLVRDPQGDPIVGTDDSVAGGADKIYPGQILCKDPTITNTGSSPAWIAAKVTLTDGAGDLTKIMGYEGYEDIDIEVLLAGGLLGETVHFGTWNGIEDVTHNDRYAMIQTADARAGVYTFYFLMLEPMQPGDEVMLFDHVTVPREWDNEEMQQLADLKIHVQAFGVQTFQLESCLKAMQQAFPAHFNIP